MVLSVLVLLSTLSLTIEKHFCGGQLIDIAIFTKLNRCGEVSDNPTPVDTLKKSCCKDEVDVIEGISDLSITSFEDLDVDLQDFVLAFLNTFYFNFEGDLNHTPHKHYRPPNLIKDYYRFNETYLI